jgi:hypothetical protein
MVWRWIIRGMGIALLTLCVAAWVGSYFECAIAVNQSKTAHWQANLEGGEFHIWYYRPTRHSGWYVRFFPYNAIGHHATLRMSYARTPYHVLGFAWRWDPTTEPQLWVMIPLWFPTTLAAGFLWLVWRKTRPKYNGKGFPVEVAATPPKA